MTIDLSRFVYAKTDTVLIISPDGHTVRSDEFDIDVPAEPHVIIKGGPGSGHHGHAGRPGKRGGSLPGGGKPELHVLSVDSAVPIRPLRDELTHRAKRLEEEFAAWGLTPTKYDFLAVNMDALELVDLLRGYGYGSGEELADYLESQRDFSDDDATKFVVLLHEVAEAGSVAAQRPWTPQRPLTAVRRDLGEFPKDVPEVLKPFVGAFDWAIESASKGGTQTVSIEDLMFTGIRLGDAVNTLREYDEYELRQLFQTLDDPKAEEWLLDAIRGMGPEGRDPTWLPGPPSPVGDISW